MSLIKYLLDDWNKKSVSIEDDNKYSTIIFLITLILLYIYKLSLFFILIIILLFFIVKIYSNFKTGDNESSFIGSGDFLYILNWSILTIFIVNKIPIFGFIIYIIFLTLFTFLYIYIYKKYKKEKIIKNKKNILIGIQEKGQNYFFNEGIDLEYYKHNKKVKIKNKKELEKIFNEMLAGIPVIPYYFVLILTGWIFLILYK